jgi:hypothetical protein
MSTPGALEKWANSVTLQELSRLCPKTVKVTLFRYSYLILMNIAKSIGNRVVEEQGDILGGWG